MILSSEKIKEKIIKKYNSNPNNWRMIFGKDNHGHYNTAIAQDSELWLIKEEQINPYKFVGYGTKISTDKSLLEGMAPYTFGLRPLSEKQIEDLITMINYDNNKLREVFSDILNAKPVSLNNVDSHLTLQGPIFSSNSSMDLISRKNKDLDLKLRKELKKIVYKKYAHIMKPYL